LGVSYRRDSQPMSLALSDDDDERFTLNEKSPLLRNTNHQSNNKQQQKTNMNRSKSVDKFLLQDGGQSNLDFEFTYWYMKERQWLRFQRGTYWAPGVFSVSWFAGFMIVYIIYLCLQLFYFERIEGHWLEFLSMLLVSAFLGYIITRFRWMIRLIAIEAYSFALFFFLLDLYSQPSKFLPLGIGTIGSVTMTLFVFFIYPYLHRCYLGGTGAMRMRVVASELGGTATRYELDVKNWLAGTMTTSVYDGAVKNGRPHGFGVWSDGSTSGEFLSGWWEAGVPVGPFESIENATRTLLSNVRIIYASCIAPNSQGLSKGPLVYGVAGVECCVSGNFFRRYPRVHMVKDSSECKCKPLHCTCIANFMTREDWRHIADVKPLETVSVTVDKKNRCLLVSGHVSKEDAPKSVTIELMQSPSFGAPGAHDLGSLGARRAATLQLDSKWQAQSSDEALLFIHGVDHSLKDACKRMAQFLALGQFPPHIKPFVFSWPSSQNFLYYFCAANLASDSNVHRELLRLFVSMREAGIRRVHLMCHSMGTRVLLRSWPIIRALFRKSKIRVDSGALPAVVALDDAGMHSEDESIEVQRNARKKRQVDNSHVNNIDNNNNNNNNNKNNNNNNNHEDDDDNDRQDKRMARSSSRQAMQDVVSEEALLQPDHDHDAKQMVEDMLGGNGVVDDDGLLELVNVVLLNPDYELAAFTYDIVSVRRYCEHITIYADHRDVAVGIPAKMTGTPGIGTNFNTLYDRNGRVIDIDVIDTGDLDRNMHNSYHGYFNVNRMMVDDLRDLIVQVKRADERTFRLKKYRACYRFSTIPKTVTMV